MSARVAIFLDYENLYISWQKRTGSRGIDPAVIDAVAAQYGPIVLRRAYDNWTQDRTNARNRLLAANYHCEDVATHRVDSGPTPARAGWRRKNMADVALTTDLMLAAARDYADVFLIGSGDGGLAYPAHKLIHPLGKTPVILATSDSLSALLREVGCPIHFYEDWLDRPAAPPLPTSAPPDATDHFASDLDTLLHLINDLRQQGLPSPTPLISLLAADLNLHNPLPAVIERARIRADLIVEEEAGWQYIYLPAEALENRRPATSPALQTRIVIVSLLHTADPRPLKDWLAYLKQRRAELPGQPPNRDLEALLTELKERNLIIEQRTGRRRAEFHLHNATLIRWLAP